MNSSQIPCSVFHLQQWARGFAGKTTDVVTTSVAIRQEPEARNAKLPRAARNGVALIVTLAVLAMLTILLVAFVSSVRVERLSSKAFSDQLKARLAAQMAIEQALADFRNTMPSSAPDYTTCTWTNGSFSSPTNFCTITSTNTQLPFFSVNPLDGSYPPYGAYLRGYGLSYPSNGILHVVVPWVYYTNSYATGSVSVVRGMIRYGYWVDDESSKINVNYAGMTNKPAFYDSSAVDLRALQQVDSVYAANIVAGRNPPYETVGALGSVSGLNFTNLFIRGAALFATVWTAEAERQTNGRTRLNINSGNYTNVAAGVAVTNLVRDISLNSPGASGLSNKFGAAIWQLAANIHDQLTPSSMVPTDSETDPWVSPAYLGIKNVPYLNEFQVSSVVYASILNSNFIIAVTNTVTWEVFNLWQTSFAGSSNVMLLRTLPGVNLTGIINTNLSANSSTVVVTTNLSMGNYSYALLSTQIVNQVLINTNSFGTLAVTFLGSGNYTNVWGAINSGGGINRFDFAVLPGRAANGPNNLNLTVPMSLLAASNTFSCSVKSPGDPRVNDDPSNWSAVAAPSLGVQNGAYSPGFAGGDGNSTTYLATGQDGGFPFVAGAFPSAGFLGVISYPTNSWMTLKMYGDGYSNYNASAKIPDWALLDIFTANQVVPGQRNAGKINVNTLRDIVADTTQDGALAGLFLDTQVNPSGKLSYGGSTLQAVVTNTMAGVPYTSIGDFASRVGCLTNPPSINTDTDWRREAMIRAVANNVTVRGSQFSVWALGQNISIVRGRTNVLGEAMAQAVFDRVEATDANTVTGVTWRVRFFRFLND